MRIVALLHRWAGGVIGLILALLGLSGAVLAWKDWWISAPGARAAGQLSTGDLGAATTRIIGDHADLPRYILFPGDSFGLFRADWGARGHYADHQGLSVAAWDSIWDRPELWLFDLHHHLFAGEAGEIAAGIVALIGLAFIVTGVVLWWRTRRTFAFRLWPKRMTRSAIVRQHRDLGIVVAPVLFLTCLTGAMMTLQPVAGVLLAPFSSAAEMEAALEPPQGQFGAINPALDWGQVYADAQARFPDAALRLVILPTESGQPITIRMKQPDEWLPNGRTMVWIAPDSGAIIATRDALRLPTGLQIFNTAYPLHAGKVGGVLWTVIVTLAGLALAILGTLATWSFWFGGAKPAPAAKARVAKA